MSFLTQYDKTHPVKKERVWLLELVQSARSLDSWGWLKEEGMQAQRYEEMLILSTPTAALILT